MDIGEVSHHRHDGTSPLPLGMDPSEPPKHWRGRFTVWPHDYKSGWSFCAMIPSWTTVPPKGGPASGPVVYFRVLVGLQSPEGSSTSRATLRRYSDFVRLYDILKRLFPNKKIPTTPPKYSFQRVNKNIQLLKQRRSDLEEWMQILLEDIELARSVAMASFLELEPLARKAIAESESEKASLSENNSNSNSNSDMDPILHPSNVNLNSNSNSNLNSESPYDFPSKLSPVAIQPLLSQSSKLSFILSPSLSPSSQDFFFNEDSFELESDDGRKLSNIDENDMQNGNVFHKLNDDSTSPPSLSVTAAQSLNDVKGSDRMRSGDKEGEEGKVFVNDEGSREEKKKEEGNVHTSILSGSANDDIAVSTSGSANDSANTSVRTITDSTTTIATIAASIDGSVDDSVDKFINDVLNSSEIGESQSQEEDEMIQSQVNQIIEEAEAEAAVAAEGGEVNSTENELPFGECFTSFELKSHKSFFSDIDSNMGSEDNMSTKSTGENMNKLFQLFSSKSTNKIKNMFFSDLSSKKEEERGGYKKTRFASAGEEKDEETYGDDGSDVGRGMQGNENEGYEKDAHEEMEEELSLIFPKSKQMIVAKTLLSVRRRLEMAASDMEDLITRLNQETAMKNYFSRKVKELEEEHEISLIRNQESLRYALTEEKEMSTALQWEVEELKNNLSNMEERWKNEKMAREGVEEDLVTSKSSMNDLEKLMKTFRGKEEGFENEKKRLQSEWEEEKKNLLYEIHTLKKENSNLKTSVESAKTMQSDMEKEFSKRFEQTEKRKKEQDRFLQEIKMLWQRLRECSLENLINEEKHSRKMQDSSKKANSNSNSSLQSECNAERDESSAKIDFSSSDILPLLETSENRLAVLVAEAEMLAREGKESEQTKGLNETDRESKDQNVDKVVFSKKGGKENGILVDFWHEEFKAVQLFRNLLLEILLENAQLRKSMNSLTLNALLVAQSDKKILPKKSFFSSKFL